MADASSSDTALNLNPKAKDQALAPHEIDLFQRALSAPLQSIPKEFETWFIDRVALLLPLIPIGQIFGFTQFTAQNAATVSTQQTTGSATYVDLGTVGPQLTGLPDGKYILMFGANSFDVSGAATPHRMSVSINGAAATDADGVWTPAVAGGCMRAVTKDLSADGNNTVTAKYRSNTGATSVAFQDRWLFALRYGNL